MRLFTVKVLDQMLYGTTEVFSPAELNSTLGAAEKWIYHVRAQQVSGTTPTLSINVYSSNDNQNWALGATLGPTSTLSSSALNLKTLSDTVSAPTGAFVRLGFVMSSSDNVANVQVNCCGRAEQNK